MGGTGTEFNSSDVTVGKLIDEWKDVMADVEDVFLQVERENREVLSRRRGEKGKRR